ncbi:hypothetical protein F4819DRAFT_503189 [Hypoxylon fuscum]|nr:hypothetical protein F4819DRAFT_503189 [Hypoxylon fuscum]
MASPQDGSTDMTSQGRTVNQNDSNTSDGSPGIDILDLSNRIGQVRSPGSMGTSSPYPTFIPTLLQPPRLPTHAWLQQPTMPPRQSYHEVASAPPKSYPQGQISSTYGRQKVHGSAPGAPSSGVPAHVGINAMGNRDIMNAVHSNPGRMVTWPGGIRAPSTPPISSTSQPGQRVFSYPGFTKPLYQASTPHNHNSSHNSSSGSYTTAQFQLNRHTTPPTIQSNIGQNVLQGPLNRCGNRTPISQPIRAQHSFPKPVTIPLLPYGLHLVDAENRRMSAEQKRLYSELEAQEKRVEAEKKRLEAEHRAEESYWPAGDTSAYPAEAVEEIQLPNSEYRVKAIHVGTPRDKSLQRAHYSVYGLKPHHSYDVQFRIARNGSSPEEVCQRPEIGFEHIQPNALFEGMPRIQVERWIRQLLAMVPGQNDTIMKWKRD